MSFEDPSHALILKNLYQFKLVNFIFHDLFEIPLYLCLHGAWNLLEKQVNFLRSTPGICKYCGNSRDLTRLGVKEGFLKMTLKLRQKEETGVRHTLCHSLW